MIEHSVTPVTPSSECTGWAVAYATAAGHGSDQEIVERVRAARPDAVDELGNTSLLGGELVAAAGMTEILASIDTHEEWARYLAPGPVALCVHTGATEHHLLVTALRQEGEAWYLAVHDPWTGHQSWHTIAALPTDYSIVSIVLPR